MTSTSSLRAGPRIRFAVIGVNHGHIDGMVETIERAGGELAAFYAKEPELAADFARRHPSATHVHDQRAILEDASIPLVLSAAIPSERASIGMGAMEHGKDFMVDKPGVTTLEQLAEVRRVQAATNRIYSIVYSERLESAATLKAGDLVRAGVIGAVVQTIGLGPHRLHPPSRPEWFWNPRQSGGILCDIGSHQFDQFLYFTGSTRASVVAARVRNVAHREHANFQDFGDAMLEGDNGSGYVRVDWFSPAGLPTWGDTRLTILGTEGYIEIRKNVDLAGRAAGNHLFVVDANGVRYLDCANEPLPFGRQLVEDVLHRTETAMSQAHCFLVMQLALEAQTMAQA